MNSSREQDLKRIKAAIEPELLLSAANALVAKGDSLALLKKLPAHSVSLILTDPPYHATKKRNGEVHLVGGDGEFAADGAPHLHVNLRPVERRLVGDLHVVDAGFDQHLAP